MKRMIPCVVIALVILGGGSALVLRVPSVQMEVVDKFIERRISRMPLQMFNGNSLNVFFCGTGSPMPSEKRAGPCVAIIAGGKFYVVDAGVRSSNNIALHLLPGERIAGVFTTNFHFDHIGDLGDLNMTTWAQGRKEPLRAFGPPGIEQVVDGFNQAYALDRSYRIAHHGPDIATEQGSKLVAHSFSAEAPIEVLAENGLTVTMFPVDHPPVAPSVGYRFDYNGRSVVVSGDTKKSPKVVAAATGADVLVHTAMAKHIVERIEAVYAEAGNETLSTIMKDIRKYHTSPVEAAEVANEAGVKELVLYHLVPSPDTAMVEGLYMRGVSEVRSTGVTLGYDCLTLTLPANSEEISQQCLAKPK